MFRLTVQEAVDAYVSKSYRSGTTRAQLCFN